MTLLRPVKLIILEDIAQQEAMYARSYMCDELHDGKLHEGLEKLEGIDREINTSQFQGELSKVLSMDPKKSIRDISLFSLHSGERTSEQHRKE